ncbi:MAG: hypothetical protein EOM03_13305 [Clostridia bacterium]|nr:hypothetical protein [Clostridia bacterium]
MDITETNTETNTTPVNEDSDAILPIGYVEGDDIFNQEAWTGDKTSTDAPGATTANDPSTEPGTGDPADEPLTPELEAARAANASLAGSPSETPTTEPPVEDKQPNNKLKFTARIDHQDREIEVDEADLPTIYQKAQATDRVQARLEAAEQAKVAYEKASPLLDKLSSLAGVMGYDTPEALLEGALDNFRAEKLAELTKEGTPEEIAKDYVDRLISAPKARKAEAKPAEPAPVPSTPAATGRDFKGEIEMLLSARPDLRGKQLPDEVINAAVRENKHVLVAYSNYEKANIEAEKEAALRENRIFKQNAASAAKAPVSGTATGGSGNNAPDDPFLKGFDSDDWN